MKRMILVLLAGTAASPALAQHSGVAQPAQLERRQHDRSLAHLVGHGRDHHSILRR